MAEARGPSAALARIDELRRTERLELMDRDDLDEERRARLLTHMDRFNRALRLYPAHARMLWPELLRARAPAGGAVRVLDVASGRGGFPRFLAAEGRRRGLPLAVTGSDVQPGHVEFARARALTDGVDVSFRLLDGFDMSDLADDAFDVVSCEQSLHHFSPGRLARMFREGARVASTAFVGIDGFPSLLLAPALVGAAALLSRSADFAHDALVTARRFYQPAELSLIARAACPTAAVEVTWHLPAFVAVRVHPPR